MSREERIKSQLIESFAPLFMEVQNESHKHSVPENSETHFNIIVVSDIFSGKNRVQRQRMVNQLLKPELNSGLHALTMKTWTQTEYEEQGGVIQNASPPCMGGSWSE